MHTPRWLVWSLNFVSRVSTSSSALENLFTQVQIPSLNLPSPLLTPSPTAQILPIFPLTRLEIYPHLQTLSQTFLRTSSPTTLPQPQHPLCRHHNCATTTIVTTNRTSRTKVIRKRSPDTKASADTVKSEMPRMRSASFVQVLTRLASGFVLFFTRINSLAPHSLDY